MFQVIGDEVRFEGYTVALLHGGVPPSVRDKVEQCLDGANYVEREELESVRRQLDDANDDCAILERDLNSCRSTLDRLEELLGDASKLLDEEKAR